MTEPTDAELDALWDENDLGPEAEVHRRFARAALANWGTSVAAEHYRSAIADACEGWTMSAGLRKHLETALWNAPSTPQPTQAQAGAVPLTEDQALDAFCRTTGIHQFVRAFMAGVRFAEQHHGIKGKEAGNADQ
ncbi:hypothetical protein [Acidovorax sp.]|uniref:hypothetical protein n=1 Tax=Acidovorax sp. TaxID=1872122 RepID=UPI0025C548E9|nr:hypothetical protein [Acidovorax sp.]MBW8463349.1 hypothetical protein [Acidovorax sp.]